MASESSSHRKVPQRLREIIQDPRTDRNAVTTPTTVLSVSKNTAELTDSGVTETHHTLERCIGEIAF